MRAFLLSVFMGISMLCSAQSVMMEGWYWNFPKTANGACWADTIRLHSRDWAKHGFTYIWMPPLSLCASGNQSNGYDPYDYYDLGTPNQQTGVGYQSKIIRMIDTMKSAGLQPVADIVCNHRTGGNEEQNVYVENFIKTFSQAEVNNGYDCYPSDRFRYILPIGGTTGLGAGTYYFKIKSASGSSNYYGKPYVLQINTKRRGINGQQLTERKPDGGAACNQPDDTTYIGYTMNASIPGTGVCGTSEFRLDLTTNEYYNAGDTLYIVTNNLNGNYSDHYIYGLWYGGTNTDISNMLIWQTATNFNGIPSKRGQMNYKAFHPDSLPTCLCGDEDYPLFYYDIDQSYQPANDTLTTFVKWMMKNVGITGLRLDAVKNMPPNFTGGLLDTLNAAGLKPGMVVGESYDYDAPTLNYRLNQVYNSMNQNTKNNILFKLFDFNLQENLRDACDAYGDDVRNVFTNGMHDNQGIDRGNIVTFVNNHDFRDSAQMVYADPILAYTYIITNPVVGTPCIYYSDYYSTNYPSYHDKFNKLLYMYNTYIKNALNVIYLNNFNSFYTSNFSSGATSNSLLYQLCGSSAACAQDKDVIVAINFSGLPMKVNQSVNTGYPYNCRIGDTLYDALGQSNFPYAIVDNQSEIYIDLPPRSYSVWVQAGNFKAAGISGSSSISLCTGDSAILKATGVLPCMYYQWQRNGVDITNMQDSTLVVKQSGTYTLNTSYGGGNTKSSNMVAISVEPGVAHYTRKADTFTCTNTGVTINWLYSVDSTTFSVVSTNAQYVATANGYYKLTISSNGCSNTISWRITNTGINNTQEKGSVHVYPNPASDYIILEDDNGTQAAIVKVYDITGNTMYTGTMNGKAQVNCSEWPAGVYQVSVLKGVTLLHFSVVKQ